MKTFTVLALLLALGACSTPAAPVMTDTACVSFHPIRVSRFDVLTPITAEQILEHNRTWEAKRCPEEPAG